MGWFAVHAIVRVAFKDGLASQREGIPTWENVILVQASGSQEAGRLGCDFAKESAGDDGGSFTWNGRVAIRTVVGIRKVVECNELSSGSSFHGVEVTYSQHLVKSEEDLARLVAGDSIELRYEE
jgi:hypothetical protein